MASAESKMSHYIFAQLPGTARVFPRTRADFASTAPDMIHFTVGNLSGQTFNTTYYPGLQMVLVGHSLFHVTCPIPPPWRMFNVTHPELNKIWWNQIIRPPSETKPAIEFRRGGYVYSYLVIRGASQFINLWWPLQSTGEEETLLSVFLRRIQRAVKGFIRTRRQSKRLALAMALHPRLGSHSILQCLPTDVLVQIYYYY